MSDADPYNWSQRKKITNLIIVAFHAMMGTFTASSIMAAFVNIAADLEVDLQTASYLTSLVIAILGGAPLFWRPLSQRYGRRPIFLISLVCSLAGNIGCAKSYSYATMALCRAITAFFVSPAVAIGSGIVVETFFKDERARYMGIWTIMVTLGIPVAPFIFGFVALRVGYRWIYYILAIVSPPDVFVSFIHHSIIDMSASRSTPSNSSSTSSSALNLATSAVPPQQTRSTSPTSRDNTSASAASTRPPSPGTTLSSLSRSRHTRVSCSPPSPTLWSSSSAPS